MDQIRRAVANLEVNINNKKLIAGAIGQSLIIVMQSHVQWAGEICPYKQDVSRVKRTELSIESIGIYWNECNE